MAKKKIKAIIFDLGGVLVHGGYLNFIRQFCRACLTSAGKRKINELEQRVNVGEITEKEFYRQIRKIFNVRLTPSQMHRMITDSMVEHKGLIKYISHLEVGKVALFTNSIGHMATEVLGRRHIPIKRLFDKVFISINLRLSKPDKPAYQYIIKTLKVKPREALMVDDRTANIRGARRAGLQGIIYKSLSQFKKDLAKYEFL